nr:hypothetical protein Ade03nite_54680 [Actinoplanes derwentensis]
MIGGSWSAISSAGATGPARRALREYGVVPTSVSFGEGFPSDPAGRRAACARVEAHRAYRLGRFRVCRDGLRDLS